MSRSVRLSPREEEILRAALEAIVPAGAGLPGSAADADVERVVRAFCESAGFSALGLALHVLELSPFLLRPLGARRFSKLPLEARVALLEAHEQSAFFLRRAAVHALKQVVMLAYYARPDVEAALGYPNPLARVPR